MSRYRYLVAGLLIASACGPAFVEPRVDGKFVALRIDGTVSAPDGAPVANAVVDVRARSAATCSVDFDQGSAISTSVGSFSRTLGRWGEPKDICVWIAVTPPAGSGLAPDTVTVQPARMDVFVNALAVDIALSALPSSAR